MSKKNYLFLLLIILFSLAVQPTMHCAESQPKKQSENAQRKSRKKTNLHHLTTTIQECNPDTPSWFISFIHNPLVKPPESNIDKEADEEVARILQRRSEKTEGILLKPVKSHSSDTLYVATACEFLQESSFPLVAEIKSLKGPPRVISSTHQNIDPNYFYGTDGCWYKIIHP